MNGCSVRVAAGLVAVMIASLPAGATLPAYTLVGSYAIPSGTVDFAPDGRMYAVAGTSILRQAAPGAAGFEAVGTLPANSINAFGASFLRFSPDGSRAAVGDGNFSNAAAIYIVDAGPLNRSGAGAGPATVLATVTTPNFDATWQDGSTLLVTGARSTDFLPLVNRVGLGTIGSPTVQTVVTGTGLASGGIAVRAGRVYVGSGFLPTGEVRSFALAGLGAGGPEAFESGSLAGSYLSASPLGFDAFGNLLAGGGDAFSGTSDVGYAAVVDLSNPGEFLRLSPSGTMQTYGVLYNSAMNEVVVIDPTGQMAYRYAVPAPSATTLVAAGLACLSRRRREC